MNDTTLNEALKMQRMASVNVGKITVDIDGVPLKAPVYTFYNDKGQLDFLLGFLGLSDEDNIKTDEVRQLRHGYVKYIGQTLYFGKNKYDLPGMIETRPAGWLKRGVKADKEEVKEEKFSFLKLQQLTKKEIILEGDVGEWLTKQKIRFKKAVGTLPYTIDNTSIKTSSNEDLRKELKYLVDGIKRMGGKAEMDGMTVQFAI